MPSAEKAAAIKAFTDYQQRVLVASSALAMGVNLPCTTVIVRDTHYPGVGAVPIHQLRQMCGRAGRGDHPGTALVLVKDLDKRDPKVLAQDLASMELADFPKQADWKQQVDVASLADRVAAVMLRNHERGVDSNFLRAWFSRSLRSEDVTEHLPAILDWMDWWEAASTEHSEYEDGQWRLTLGDGPRLRMASLWRIAGGILQLWRDLLQVELSDRLLEEWSVSITS